MNFRNMMEHVGLVLPTILSFLGSELYLWRFHFGIFSGIKMASSSEGNQWPQSRRGSGSVDVGISYEPMEGCILFLRQWHLTYVW